jgi:hypothetical protein
MPKVTRGADGVVAGLVGFVGLVAATAGTAEARTTAISATKAAALRRRVAGRLRESDEENALQ